MFSYNIQRHSVKYPIVALMARDFLSCSGTSCAPERLFSRAADVCSSSRGSLQPLTIERLVSTSSWLSQGVSVGKDFQKVLAAVDINKTVIDVNEF